MADPIVPKPLPTAVRSESRCTYIGPLSIVTPRGTVAAEEVRGLLTLENRDAAGRPSSILVLLHDPAAGSGPFTQLSAASARQIGASLINLANRADGGGPVQ